MLEHRGERARVAELADQWFYTHHEYLGFWTNDTYRWIRKLAPLADPRAPAVFAQPLSQLAVFIDPDHPPDVGELPPVFARYRHRVFEAIQLWIDRAFTAVVPEVGRWQQFDGEWLEAHPVTFDAAEPLQFFGPLVMSIALRRRVAREAIPLHTTMRLGYLMAPRTGAPWRDHQRAQMASLDREQRAVIYACTLVHDNQSPGEEAWGRVWEAERDHAREDWFELFSPG